VVFAKPVVTPVKEPDPIPVLHKPVVRLFKELDPIAVFWLPLKLGSHNALFPKATLLVPTG